MDTLVPTESQTKLHASLVGSFRNNILPLAQKTCAELTISNIDFLNTPFEGDRTLYGLLIEHYPPLQDYYTDAQRTGDNRRLLAACMIGIISTLAKLADDITTVKKPTFGRLRYSPSTAYEYGLLGNDFSQFQKEEASTFALQMIYDLNDAPGTRTPFFEACLDVSRHARAVRERSDYFAERIIQHAKTTAQSNGDHTYQILTVAGGSARTEIIAGSHLM